MTPRDTDPPPEDTPLESPMPRSKTLDNEEPELDTGEPDIPSQDSDAPG